MGWRSAVTFEGTLGRDSIDCEGFCDKGINCEERDDVDGDPAERPWEGGFMGCVVNGEVRRVISGELGDVDGDPAERPWATRESVQCVMVNG